jgi:hypothetical protein
MRAKWKILVISKLLYKYFFLRRPTSCLFHENGKFRFKSVLVRDRLIRLWEYKSKALNWYSRTSYRSRKFFFVQRTDYILPVYQGRRFWVSSGKRLVPISADYNKVRTRFGMYCHTKKYSPIHRGTNFIFKGIKRRGKFQPFLTSNRRKKKGGGRNFAGNKSSKKSVHAKNFKFNTKKSKRKSKKK